MKRHHRISCLFLFLAASLPAIDLTVRPSARVPVADSARWFLPGGGLGLSAALPLAGTPLALTASFDTTMVPHRARSVLWMFQAHPGIELAWPLGPSFDGGLTLGGGGAYAVRANLEEGAFVGWVGGGASVRWNLEPTLRFRGAVEYHDALGLYQAVGLWIGFEITEGAAP